MVKAFTQLLSQYVEESGMKQTRVASAAQISSNYLLRLLAGDRHPSEQVVYKLAKALRLSTVQTGALLASAGYTPPLDLLQPLASSSFSGGDAAVFSLRSLPLCSLRRGVFAGP